MKRIYIPVLLILIVVVTWFAIRAVDSGRTGGEIALAKEYTSTVYPVSFRYPEGYYLEEKDIDLSRRVHHQVILIEDTADNRAVSAGEAPGREGPTAITVDIYQNDLDRQSVMAFILNSSDSNYKLGDGQLATTTRGSLEGLEYSWSGLYEGRSFVVSRPDYVYMFSVTRIDPRDRILTDFNRVMHTVKIR